MNLAGEKLIPAEAMQDSVLVRIAAAYFSVGKQLERKTQCSATRGFIMAALRDGVTRNQNQIATLVGLDRTVVHRAIKAMVQEGLASEKKAPSGKAILVKLTPKGERYRALLIKERMAADEKLSKQLTSEERTTLLGVLKRVAELEL